MKSKLKEEKMSQAKLAQYMIISFLLSVLRFISSGMVFVFGVNLYRNFSENNLYGIVVLTLISLTIWMYQKNVLLILQIEGLKRIEELLGDKK